MAEAEAEEAEAEEAEAEATTTEVRAARKRTCRQECWEWCATAMEPRYGTRAFTADEAGREADRGEGGICSHARVDSFPSHGQSKTFRPSWTLHVSTARRRTTLWMYVPRCDSAG